MEDGGTIQAQRLAPGGPGEQAGIKPGDKLLAVNEQPVNSIVGLNRHLYKTGYGVWSKPTYQLDRHGVKVQVPVILGQVDKSLNFPLRLIALVYLGIGFYVLFRRWTAPKSIHFYCFALTSFVLYAFHYTGKLNTFDDIVLCSSIVSGMLQPALFLHFALTLPAKQRIRETRCGLPLLYPLRPALLPFHSVPCT